MIAKGAELVRRFGGEHTVQFLAFLQGFLRPLELGYVEQRDDKAGQPPVGIGERGLVEHHRPLGSVGVLHGRLVNLASARLHQLLVSDVTAVRQVARRNLEYIAPNDLIARFADEKLK